MKTLRFGWMIALCGLTALGCSSDKTAAPLKIIGQYNDNFGADQIITAKDWNGSAIVAYDNDKNFVFTQNASDAMFYPSKFAKTVYTEPKDGSFYFCEVEFMAATLADAEASTATWDDSDPATTGCGGKFPWTKATKK
jgi:hypothetical protein